MSYYYLDEDKKPQGPFSLHDLEDMAEELPARTRCCKKGDDKWLPIEVVIASHISNHLGTNDKMGKLVAFVNEQLGKVSAYHYEENQGDEWAERNILKFHIRTQWMFKDIPVNELNVSQLEWKFNREEDFTEYNYYLLRVASDFSYLFFMHSYSDAGVLEDIKHAFEPCSSLSLRGFYDERTGLFGGNLSEYIKYIVESRPPNRTDLS